MRTPWLDIIGVTEQGVASLGPDLQALMKKAEVIIGVPRRLADLFPGDGQTLVEWDGALEDMVVKILQARRAPTILLASGDPNWFGIGATLSRRLPLDEFALHPAPSSFQLAAARMHWPLQNVTTLSLHGRAISLLHPHLLPGNRILALTSDAEGAKAAAKLMVERGYGQSLVTVLENFGGPEENVLTSTAAALENESIGDFHILAIDCVADEGAVLLPSVPGLPDEAFINDGQLTKRDARATTLAKLAPVPGALLWDVGAGCGSIGIEWMRAARDARAIAFESDEARCGFIAANREALGTPGLAIVPGEAPETLSGQPAPDAVFLGGDVANDALFEACWSALNPGGRFVANAVTSDGEAALFRRHGQFGGELTRIEISILDTVGFAPRRPVTQWATTKGAAQ